MHFARFGRSRRANGPPLDQVIDALYRAVLRRPVDPAGLIHWSEWMHAGGRTYDTLADELLRSAEAQDLHRLGPIGPPPIASTPRVYFLHIMKTGGTTVVEAIDRGLPGLRVTGIFMDHLVCLPPTLLERTSFVSGHLGFEATEVLPSARVCTVLREPVDRVLSHYGHVRRNPDVALENPNLTLDEFVSSPRWSSLASDYQARHLAHRVEMRQAWHSFHPLEKYRRLGSGFPKHNDLPLQSSFDCSPLEHSPSELATMATNALDRIDVVGTTDRLGEFVGRVLDRESPDLGRRNAATRRPEVEDLPTQLIRRIRAANEADLELYERARQLAAV